MFDPGHLPKEHIVMPGEDDLQTLLHHMKPEMQEGIFVFCSLPGAKDIPAALAPDSVKNRSLSRAAPAGP
jgi:ACT domain